jgi:hypothetical protein
VKLLDVDVELRDDVDPERRSAAEQLADRLVRLALRGLELRVAGRRPGERDVLAEVERDSAVASTQRPGADPDQLAPGAELIEPRGAVGAEAARKHVALPYLWSERDPLERHERLAKPVRPRASGAVSVDVLPACEEPRQLALVGGLDLVPQVSEARAPHATKRLGVAPLALGAAGEQLAAHQLSRALELAQGGKRVDAIASRELAGGERPVGARVAAHQRDHRVVDRLEEGLGEPGGGRHAEGIAVEPSVLGGDPAFLAGHADPGGASLALELGEHRGRRVALGHPLCALVLGEVADTAQDDLERVAVAGPARIGAVLERVLHFGERRRVDQLAQLLLTEKLAQELSVERERRGAPLGVRGVALVHVGGHVVEEQRGGKRRGRRGLDLDERDPA